MDKKELATIEKTAQKLLSLLGVQAPFTVQEIEDGIEVVLETEENGMLIGYHGETLEALQLILSLCIAKPLGRFVHVSVEVGQYKKNRMEYLQNLVSQTKEQVLAEQKGIALPDLKSWERKYVHTMLAEDPQVMSESSGEGRERMLTIYPRS